MDGSYLDNNATTMPAPEVLDAMDQAGRELWANPSSVHRFGQQVRQRVELARQSVAGLIGAAPRELVFTSGGTESANLATFGLTPTPAGLTLITTGVEHAAVREPAEHVGKQGGRVVWLAVDSAGRVELDGLAKALAQAVADEERSVVLVSIQWANNETGVIQPIPAIAEAVALAKATARERGRRIKLLLHVDATQAVGKLPVDVDRVGVDLLTFSAHKFHGPKGVGALWLRRGVRLSPLQRGGPQERERRGGTENTTGIIGMGVAADLARRFLDTPQNTVAIQALRDRLERGVVSALPDTVVNSRDAPRLWNTTSLGFPGVEAEAVLLGLSEKGICASAGAACSSGSLEPSPVLLAMGIPEPVAHGSVRFSLSRYTRPSEIDRALEAVPAVVGRLMRTMPMG
ncbi:MAG: cysteine desulfurase family protein [Planctomycetota bacterium]